MSNLIRNCPLCGCELSYSTKNTMKQGEKTKSKCKSCSKKGGNNPMYGKSGMLNPFFGKTHTDDSKSKIIQNRDYSKYKTDEFRKKLSNLNKGEKNNMYGKSLYSVWLEKYGKEIANKKMSDFKLKQSILNKGEKNSMYGKPSPINSGNGICGWYKGWFFRSLLELSYMLYVIERYNFIWECGENKNYKIQYNIDGVNKNYFPDFIIDGKYVVECKPKRLWDTKINKVKFEYAKKFCEDNGLIFKIRDIPKIKKPELLLLIDSGIIVLTNKWKNKI